ncbi:MAG: HNH endonuclease signature motif containing protein [Jhaorihella sp.]
MSNRRGEIMDRIIDRTVILTNGCWEWQGPFSGNGRGGGYPRMSLDGQTVAVHRVVYTHVHGYIPGKKQIDHVCRNRACVNPDHLEMVTHRTNQKRRAAAAPPYVAPPCSEGATYGGLPQSPDQS